MRLRVTISALASTLLLTSALAQILRAIGPDSTHRLPTSSGDAGLRLARITADQAELAFSAMASMAKATELPHSPASPRKVTATSTNR